MAMLRRLPALFRSAEPHSGCITFGITAALSSAFAASPTWWLNSLRPQASRGVKTSATLFLPATAAGTSATGQAATEQKAFLLDARRFGLVSQWGDAHYGVALPDPAAAGELLLTPGVLWAAAKLDAAAAKEMPATYIERVLESSLDLFDAKEADGLPRVVNHEGTLAALGTLGSRKGKGLFILLTGPRSVGKSLMLRKMANELANKERRVLYVDARQYGTDLTAGIASAIASDTKFTERFVEIMKTASGAVLPDALSAATGFPTPAAFVRVIASITDGSKREKLLSEMLGGFFSTCKHSGDYPVIFIDEANKAFKAAAGDKDAALRVVDVLDLLTRVTKQEREASVVLATSEHGLPFRLRALGFNTDHISKTIVAEEVPPAVMKGELMRTWGCGEHLATALLSLYGGHVLHASAAVRELATSTDPASMEGVAAVGSLADAPAKCLSDRTFIEAGVPASEWLEMRERVTAGLRALVETGSIPLDSAEDKVAEIISLANAGCVVPRAAAASGVPPGAWLARTSGGELPTHILVPSSHVMRLLIARKMFPRRV